MKQFNRIIYGVILLWLMMAAGFIYVSFQDRPDKQEKAYLVEINRFQDQIIRQGEFREIDLSKYTYLIQVDYLQPTLANMKVGIGEEGYTAGLGPDSFPLDGDTISRGDISTDFTIVTPTSIDLSIYINSFFEGKELKIFGIKSVPKKCDFVIRPLYIDHELKGYMRYSYRLKGEENIVSRIWLPILVLCLSFLIILSLLFYIKINILSPFHEISELPYELSKGHLSKALKENKNRYFGKFLWGLDLLRESLEEHKRIELQMEKDKKLMILSISHDIKTPLSTIKLYSKALYEDLYDTEEKRHKTARNIEEKADQIERFVADIIRTSSTDLFEFNINSEDFYLSRLMKTIQRTYEEKLALLKINFIIHPYLDKLLHGDLDKLIDVFDNILQNAIKYGDGKNITFHFEEEENCQLIRVTNTGTPLPSTDFIHMFESFWRGANAHGMQGNGLGLYICKQMMHKMGGEIFAEAGEDGMSLVVVIRKS
jgi:signal transduction histidine kinase